MSSMFHGRYLTYLLVIFKGRTIIHLIIRNKIYTIIFLICICSFISSALFKNIRQILQDNPDPCNDSSSEDWVDIFVPSQVRTVRVKVNHQFPSESKSKTILLWTKFFSNEYSSDFYFFQNGQHTFKKYKCRFSDCIVTSNKSLLPSVDAVLFHGKDLHYSVMHRDLYVPKRPRDDQIWILYSMESPRYMVQKWSLIQSLFNWTMTYRSDSDIQVKYGEIFERNDPCTPLTHKNVSERSKGAILMVSNCRTQSRREAYVRELRKFFSVDVYGKCSRKNRCEPAQSEACYELLNNYKYYLSFENSICKDYITEKFFNVLQYDIVPVVFGGGNYASIAPKNSFIDATKFPNPRDLAEHLTEISNNYSLYDSFFDWKSHYSVHLHPWMCDLCERLHEPNTKPKTMPKPLWGWWISKARCRQWRKNEFI